MPEPSDGRVLMVSISYRMKSRQLRKLYIKYLQFCIRHSRHRAAVLGMRVWRAGSRECLVPKAVFPPGGGRAVPGDVLGIREVPGGEVGKDGAPVW